MSQGLGALRVLVVDDNRHVRANVCELLKAVGVHDARQARDGEEALTLLRLYPCDLALVNLDMAPMDGVGFALAVRNAPDSPDVHLPLIAVTGLAERARVEAARDAGVNEVVLKPLTAAALLGRLEAVIQRPRPFVRAPSYFGPDRRRRADPAYAGPLRRLQDDAPNSRTYVEL